jgi:hypothetical protein
VLKTNKKKLEGFEKSLYQGCVLALVHATGASSFLRQAGPSTCAGFRLVDIGPVDVLGSWNSWTYWIQLFQHDVILLMLIK